ncbi:hypothetical protein LEMLEM_LOCUS6712 [Lemmus lemmus]
MLQLYPSSGIPGISVLAPSLSPAPAFQVPELPLPSRCAAYLESQHSGVRGRSLLFNIHRELFSEVALQPDASSD